MTELEKLQSALEYDQESGQFFWKIPAGPRVKKGQIAGTPDKDGYIRIGFSGKLRSAHRLAWLFAYGEWPASSVDHKDGARNNNRLSNLRLATLAQNLQNSKAPTTNKSGYKGISWDKRDKKWRAQISTNGQYQRLGTFKHLADAVAAMKAFREMKHGEFCRHI